MNLDCNSHCLYAPEIPKFCWHWAIKIISTQIPTFKGFSQIRHPITNIVIGYSQCFTYSVRRCSRSPTEAGTVPKKPLLDRSLNMTIQRAPCYRLNLPRVTHNLTELTRYQDWQFVPAQGVSCLWNCLMKDFWQSNKNKLFQNK